MEDDPAHEITRVKVGEIERMQHIMPGAGKRGFVLGLARMQRLRWAAEKGG